MNQQSTEVTGVTDKTDTGAVEDLTVGVTGTAEDATTADNTDEGCTSSGGGRATDEARLLERGVELHALSADEGEGDDLEEEMDVRDLTPEEAAAATAVLDANDDDQEGLVLTGGDWFNTIKQVAKTNKEAEKELAARMKKAKISQTSLENEVFEGEPSNQSSADAGPGLLRKDPPPLPVSRSPPPHSQKKWIRTRAGTKDKDRNQLWGRSRTRKRIRLWTRTRHRIRPRIRNRGRKRIRI
jgi:hypothetical protein